MWNSRKEVGVGGKAGREAQFRFSSQKKKNQKRCNMLRILVPFGCSVLLFFSFSAGCDKSFSFSSGSKADLAIQNFVLFSSSLLNPTHSGSLLIFFAWAGHILILFVLLFLFSMQMLLAQVGCSCFPLSSEFSS